MVEIVVIVESAADFRTGTKLAERVIIENVDWIDEDIFEHCVVWSGLLPESDHSCWRDVKSIFASFKADGLKLPRPRERQGRSDGATTKRVLRLIRALQTQRGKRVDGILLIRDSDGDTERIKTLKLVQEQFAEIYTIAIGMANPKREAWVLNGFVPKDDSEWALLSEIKNRNTFDPTIEAHRLRETLKQEPQKWRNAKVVLDYLMINRFEQECWEEPELGFLRERGRETGLTAYLGEVAERLVPIVRTKQTN